LTGRRITIVAGHYGVGKSEFSINLALMLRQRYDDPMILVDLDVVNPYFRSREARGVLEAGGVTVIGNSLGIDAGIDLPAIPASAGRPFADPGVRAVIDLGGDPAGARALAQFRPQIHVDDVDSLYTVNAFRPETRDAAAAYASLRAIESVMDMKFTGLINNSHLVHETEPRHVVAGETICRELAQKNPDLAVRYVGGLPGVLAKLDTDAIHGERVPLTLYLRAGWMAEGNVHSRGPHGG